MVEFEFRTLTYALLSQRKGLNIMVAVLLLFDVFTRFAQMHYNIRVIQKLFKLVIILHVHLLQLEFQNVSYIYT